MSPWIMLIVFFTPLTASGSHNATATVTVPFATKSACEAAMGVLKVSPGDGGLQVSATCLATGG